MFFRSSLLNTQLDVHDLKSIALSTYRVQRWISIKQRPDLAPHVLLNGWSLSKFPEKLTCLPNIHFKTSPRMLGRAVKEFNPPNPKRDVCKELFSSNGLVKDRDIGVELQKPREPTLLHTSLPSYQKTSSSQTNYIPNGGLITNQKRPLAQSNSLTKPSTSTSKGLYSVLCKPDPFEEAQEKIDANHMSSISTSFNKHLVEFNEEDFDDDADLDLDCGPLRSTSQLQPNVTNELPTSTHDTLNMAKAISFSSNHQPSSAISWPSSSPSHKLTPPGVKNGQKRAAHSNIEDSSHRASRSSKRRTLPWIPEDTLGEISSISDNPEIFSSSGTLKDTSFTKQPNSNQASPNSGDFAASEEVSEKEQKIDPQKKSSRIMPWNTTESMVKETKTIFKNARKASKRVGRKSGDNIDDQPITTKPVVAPFSLSEEQKRVLNLVVNKSKSVFFTGSAGTGKSILMRAIITELKKKYCRENDRVAVTASTGLAACNIGGVTLHSFGGIGLGKEDVAALVRRIKKNPKARSRWIRTKILIIDEISMVDGELFDKLEGVARAMRNNGRPFGGIQLVITGDFFQLPPVPERDDNSRAVKFAFDASTWSTTIDYTIGLTQVFRQKDPMFANMLNEMRIGKITDETVTAFQKLNRPVSDQGLEATELFPTRHEVDKANATRIGNLGGTSYKYVSQDGGAIKDPKSLERLLSNMMAPKVLELKKGAQVMLIKNMDESLVNGTLGKVQSFMSEKDFKHLEDIEGGLDALEYESENDAGGKPRISTNGVSTTGSGRLYPYVSFKLADGTKRMMLILPEEWKVELPNGEVQAQRSQVPLILAWALSIHKAQGQTLERVKIDLKKIFEKGQAYVALSRATSQAGLQVLNFDKVKVNAHPRVAQFYNNLYESNQALKDSIT
ncbi:BgTH12-07016 [Blumeria graminis f. sp. triticale]|uniref:ATP-dependent DNA helicase PIF1 n=1 Tax=Blumeria graminis f. sp. triticale TaxID=1689686 RepID=A0A9W4DE05_BLUGR|nr:BgTH12-07016 [Blumeria graminis f. sp. triticale]